MAQKLQMCDTEDEMREVAAKICRNYLYGSWKTIDPKELTFKRISGGLSNFLYYIALPSCNLTGTEESKTNGSPQQRRCTLASVQDGAKVEDDADNTTLIDKPKPRSNSLTVCEEPKKVLLRIYGQIHGERAVDALITESVIFTLLSERRLGPKLHGVFSGGRIEEYIPARPLLTAELSEPALSMKIAEKMAAIHAMDIPLSKEPQWLWKTLYKWTKTVIEILQGAEEKTEDEKICVEKLKAIDFEKELDWLKQYLTSIESPVVFCHNDMQEGNILLKEDPVHSAEDTMEDSYSNYDFESSSNPQVVATVKRNGDNKGSNGHPGSPNFMEDETSTRDSMYSHLSDNGEPKLVLIDFEYCSYNYRGFDLANHFVEWSYDYTNPEHPHYYMKPQQYPTLEQKVIFMRQYLKHCNIQLQRVGNRDPQLDVEPTIEEINQLDQEVEAFTLASHMLWCIWSVISSRNQIPFGYWRYAVSRLEGYQQHKMELMKKDNSSIGVKRKICEVDI